MSYSETDNLAALVRRRHALVVQLRELVRRQAELIAAEELTHLMTLLAGKQRVLVQLQGVERELDPFRHQDPAARQWRNPAEREKCARLVADCESLLAEIVGEEQTSEQSMRNQRDQVAGSLRHAHAAGAARGAYAASARSNESRLDLSSEL